MVQQRVFSKGQLHAVAFVALVLGIKFMVTASFGNTVPYWDQWDAEIDRLYRPWLEGSLDWSSMLAAHNEHRVFTGRVLALLLFVLGGNVLDPMLQSAVNALVHTIALLLLLQALLKVFPYPAWRFPATLVLALIVGAPLGVENILFNNSALYFLILFAILFLVAIARQSESNTAGWFIAVLAAGLLGCLSFASGLVTLTAGVVLLGVQWLTGVRRTPAAIVMVVLLIAMIGLALFFTPTVSGHSSFKSRSVIDFAVAILAMTGGLVLYAPAVVFMFRQLRKKPQASDPSWFLFALLLWIFGQMVIIAYGRGHSNVMASRYLDLYTIGFVANFVALFVNMKDSGPRESLQPLRGWMVLFFILIGIALPGAAKELAHSRAKSLEAESRLRTYLCTHDRQVLDEPDAKLPYPDPARLKLLLDQSVVQSMMPPVVSLCDPQTASKSRSGFSKALFVAGSILAGLGTGLFCCGLFDGLGASDDGAVLDATSSR